MSDENMLLIYPQKRIKPYDGMEITADIWEQAHLYHRQVQQAHDLFFHGSGILSGLEVVASDPADKMIFILPGIAVDSHGKTIVLTEPVAYDIGDEVDGLLYLYITYRENEQIQQANTPVEAPHYAQSEFLITARPTLPETHAVELARFRRETRTSALQDAGDALRPGMNEIDLRYRRKMAIQSDTYLTAAVVYLGKIKQKLNGRGLAFLAKELNPALHLKLIVEDDVQFDPGVLGFTMIYLVAEGNFKFSEAQMKALKGYIENGGFLLLESVDEAARKVFESFCDQLNLSLAVVESEHPLLSDPYRFSNPPEGFNPEGVLLAREGVVLSSKNYGRMWFGDSSQGNASRDTIRAAMEWGANLLSYIVKM